MENTKKWFEFKGGKLAVIDIESGHFSVQLFNKIDSINNGAAFDNTMLQILHDINGSTITKKKMYQYPTFMHENGLIVVMIKEKPAEKKKSLNRESLSKYYYGTWDKHCPYSETYNKKTGKIISKSESEEILSIRKAIDDAVESYYRSFTEVSICGPFIKSRYNNLSDYIAFIDDIRFTFPEMFDYNSDKYIGLEYVNTGRDILLLEYLKYLQQISNNFTRRMEENDVKNIFRNWIDAVIRYEEHGIQTHSSDILYCFDIPYKNIEKIQVGTMVRDVVKYSQHSIDKLGTVISIDYPTKNKYRIYTLSKSKDKLADLTKFVRDILNMRGVQYVEWNTTT